MGGAMNNTSSSCTVAPITKCNHATVTYNNATHNETTAQPRILLSLAIKVLERNKSNRSRNSPATSQLHHTETNATKELASVSANTELRRGETNKSLATTGKSQESCRVAFPIEHNHATHFTCQQCGYRKPFCSCKLIAGKGMAICNDCEHFTVDDIGDGAGIGNCELGIKWTQEFTGRMPLFRYSERHCEQFSKLMD
jgi:predicted nucleic-acid-binding Zn-ribbon protein